MRTYAREKYIGKYHAVGSEREARFIIKTTIIIIIITTTVGLWDLTFLSRDR